MRALAQVRLQCLSDWFHQALHYYIHIARGCLSLHHSLDPTLQHRLYRVLFLELLDVPPQGTHDLFKHRFMQIESATTAVALDNLNSPPFSSVCGLTALVVPRRARGMISGRVSARSSSSRFSETRRPASTLFENASSGSSASD
jgi:hypothetical protein